MRTRCQEVHIISQVMFPLSQFPSIGETSRSACLAFVLLMCSTLSSNSTVISQGGAVTHIVRRRVIFQAVTTFKDLLNYPGPRTGKKTQLFHMLTEITGALLHPSTVVCKISFKQFALQFYFSNLPRLTSFHALQICKKYSWLCCHEKNHILAKPVQSHLDQ